MARIPGISRRGFTLFEMLVVLALLVVLFGLALRGQITERNPEGIELTSWYWHFVDGVWIVVFLLVYVIGR